MPETKLKQQQAMENKVCFRSHTITGQTLTASSYQIIELDVEDFDPNGNFDTGTYKYTAPVDGVYMVCAGVRMDNMLAGENTYVTVYKNGSDGVAVSGAKKNNTGGTADPLVFAQPTLVQLAATDTLEMQVFHDGASSRDTIPASVNTYLSAHLVTSL